MSTGINVTKPIKILDEGVLLTSDVSQIDFTGGVTATTVGNNVTVNVPAAGITVGTTPVTSGTDGRVFFQAGGVIQQDANFTFDNTLKRLTLKAVGTAATDIPFAVQNSAGTGLLFQATGDGKHSFNMSPNTNFALSIDQTSQNGGIAVYSSGQVIFNVAKIAGSVGYMGVLNNGNYSFFTGNSSYFNHSLVVGGNSLSPGARLDVRAQGALSTDIAFRVRNSADTQDLFSIRGNKDIYLPSTGGGTNVVRIYANADDTFGPNTLLTYGRKGSGNIAINESSTFAVGGFQQTAIGIGAAVSADGGVSLGDTATVDSGATNGIAIGKFSRGFGSNFIAIGTGPATNQTYGGNNTIVLGNRIGGFGININNVFFTYFASNNVTTITRDNGSFGLLGQQVEVRDATQLTNNMGNGGNTLVVMNHTAVPSTNITNAFQLYSNDITAGNAAPHFRTEAGDIIKLYKETTAVAAATLVGNAGTNITDTDTFDGYTIQQIVKALRNQGLLA